jgi:hypothetical protein
MGLDRREREALDRYITGNYGEDQQRDEDEGRSASSREYDRKFLLLFEGKVPEFAQAREFVRTWVAVDKQDELIELIAEVGLASFVVGFKSANTTPRSK